jgi:lipoprotein-anchoring transpeptidase ErfK/SrfK
VPQPTPLPAAPATVATATVPSVPVYPGYGAASPGQTLANPNNLGAPLVFLATATEGDFVQVYLPERPNEAQGWVPRADVTFTSDPYRITISLSARQLTLYNAGAVAFQTSVAPGEPTSPTPTGHFYVTEVLRLSDAGSAYGPYALGTSGFSNTYFSFDGGPGQVAIHGTNQPWLIGGYASHGCVRLTNDAITSLAQQVKAGTPVEIDP